MKLKWMIVLRSSLVVVFVAAGALFLFQNCGQSDGSGGGTSAPSSQSTVANTKYAAAPFPYAIDINQIAYMTCPKVDKNTGTPEDVDNPFFTIRVGAFDNRPLANRYPQVFTNTASDPERTYRLKAGIGLSPDYVNYMKSTFASKLAASSSDSNALKSLLREGIQQGGDAANVQPVLGIVMRQRSAQGFTWAQVQAGKWILAPLTELNTANALVAGLDMGIYGYERVNYLTGVSDLSHRSFVASINGTSDEVSRDFLRDQIGTNLEVVVGYAANGGDITNVQTALKGGATGDNYRTLSGRVYRLTTSQAWPGRIDLIPASTGSTTQVPQPGQSIHDDFIQGVQEVDTSATAEKDISLADSQQWDCFSLMIVRDLDRRDTTTQKYFEPDTDLTLRNGTLKLKFYDYQPTATSTIIPGVRVACPPQDIVDVNSPGTLNYTADGGLARLRLEVARRFLPAESFEINTNPEYMCAVPRPSVANFGTCYSSGDFDASKYVMYSQQGLLLGKAITCGKNQTTGEVQNECPAFVSICYRKQ